MVEIKYNSIIFVLFFDSCPSRRWSLIFLPLSMG